MPFVWIENIAVDALIESADLQEIRDNVDWVEDNKCAADDGTVNATHNETVQNNEDVGYDLTDRGTVQSGDDSGYDGNDNGTYKSGFDTGYDSYHYVGVDYSDEVGHDGTYNSGVNSDHRMGV